MLGEIHGTNEFPQLVYDYVKKLSNDHKSVHLLLEIPTDNQVLIDQFLKKHNSNNQITSLTNSYFWQRKTQDGRSSKAMLNLISNIKAFNKSASIPIAISTFSAPPTKEQSTDQAYFHNVMKIINNSNNDMYVIYTGRIHARKNFELQANQPLLATLLQNHVKVLSYQLIAGNGSFWACYLGQYNKVDCGVKELKTKNSTHQIYNKFVIDDNYSNYHDGYYHIKSERKIQNKE